MRSPDAADIRLDQLSHLTGLSPMLIRAWERRYGFPAAARTGGGHRRYTREQAEVLRRAALLTRSGFRAADAIARARAEDAVPALPDARGIEQLAALLVAPDPVFALDRLRASWLGIGFEATLEELVLPALGEIGEGWASHRLSVAQEHVATGVVMSWLGVVRGELPMRDLGPPRYLIATPEGEEHGVAVWALELLLRMRGVGSLALGVGVPAADLASAATRLRPHAVVLAISTPTLKRAAGGAARALRGLAEPPGVYLGGAGAVPPLPAGISPLPSTLTEAAGFLALPAAEVSPTNRR